MAENNSVLRVCSLLNEQGARYFIAGGQAAILHGLIRNTEVVDILIEATEENCAKVIAALSRLADGAAKELSPRHLLENVVVKIADEVEVDVSTLAWKVSYPDALPTGREITIEGVRIPFLGLDSLIASKETYREKDQLDVMQLRALRMKQ